MSAVSYELESVGSFYTGAHRPVCCFLGLSIQVKPPLRFQVLEFVKEKKAATDDEILDSLNKSGACSMNELNKCLMDLEILGAVSIRWVAKEKRRVEFVETPLEATRYGEG